MSLRRLPFVLPPIWKASMKSMSSAPRPKTDVEAAEVAAEAETSAVTVASMASAVVVAVAVAAVTSTVSAVVAVAVDVAVVTSMVNAVNADPEEMTVRVVATLNVVTEAAVAAAEAVLVVTAMANAAAAEAVAMTEIAEVVMLSAVTVVEEAVAVVVTVVTVVLAPKAMEKVAKVVAAEREEIGEILMSAMDISRVTDKMAPAVDVVETARVATSEVAGVVMLPKKKARFRTRKTREPRTAPQKRKRRRRLLVRDANPSQSRKRKKKLDSLLMTTWPRNRPTRRDFLLKRAALERGRRSKTRSVRGTATSNASKKSKTLSPGETTTP